MRRISQCLNTQLTDILQRATLLNKLNDKLLNYLPEQLRDHFTVGSFTNGYLVLVTPDPVWASQLRYHLPELRDYLRKEAGIYQLASIKINVSTLANMQTPTPQPKFPPISTQARKTILTGSEQCSYEPLKDALKNLAKNTLS